jgi:hypothetical protein
MTQTLEQAALSIATALAPQAQAAVDALAVCKAALDAIYAATPAVGSSRDAIADAAKVQRNYAHRIAEPLMALGVTMDLSAFDEAPASGVAP